MDLSKIPEPSEDAIRRVLQFVADGSTALRLVDSQEFCRVIAHLLRHGSVLAKNIDIEMVDSEKLGEVMAAISFFEKFGGNDER